MLNLASITFNVIDISVIRFELLLNEVTLHFRLTLEYSEQNTEYILIVGRDNKVSARPLFFTTQMLDHQLGQYRIYANTDSELATVRIKMDCE